MLQKSVNQKKKEKQGCQNQENNDKCRNGIDKFNKYKIIFLK